MPSIYICLQVFVNLFITVLEQLETDKVYIIGGLVDETPNKVSGGYYFINILHNISVEQWINTVLYNQRMLQQWTISSSLSKSHKAANNEIYKKATNIQIPTKFHFVFDLKIINLADLSIPLNELSEDHNTL